MRLLCARDNVGPDPSLAVVGGFARSVSGDILGEWAYDYWQAAYGAIRVTANGPFDPCSMLVFPL